MKAATGELNLTVITVVAIAAIMLFFTGVLWPRIRTSVNNQWDSIDQNSDSEGNISNGTTPP